MAEGAFLLENLYEKADYLISALRNEAPGAAARSAQLANAPSVQPRAETAAGGQGHTETLSWQPKVGPVETGLRGHGQLHAQAR